MHSFPEGPFWRLQSALSLGVMSSLWQQCSVNRRVGELGMRPWRLSPVIPTFSELSGLQEGLGHMEVLPQLGWVGLLTTVTHWVGSGYFSPPGVPGMIWGHTEVEKPSFFLGTCNLTCKDTRAQELKGEQQHGTVHFFTHCAKNQAHSCVLPNQTERRWSWELNSGPP